MMGTSNHVRMHSLQQPLAKCEADLNFGANNVLLAFLGRGEEKDDRGGESGAPLLLLDFLFFSSSYQGFYCISDEYT